MIASGDIADSAVDAIVWAGSELPARASTRRSEHARNVMDLILTRNDDEEVGMCLGIRRQQFAGFGLSPDSSKRLGLSTDGPDVANVETERL